LVYGLETFLLTIAAAFGSLAEILTGGVFQCFSGGRTHEWFRAKIVWGDKCASFAPAIVELVLVTILPPDTVDVTVAVGVIVSVGNGEGVDVGVAVPVGVGRKVSVGGGVAVAGGGEVSVGGGVAVAGGGEVFFGGRGVAVAGGGKVAVDGKGVAVAGGREDGVGRAGVPVDDGRAVVSGSVGVGVGDRGDGGEHVGNAVAVGGGVGDVVGCSGAA
jgi:hypothetical protein